MDLSSTIYTHLGQVNDPEIPVLSLHDMGILRGVNVLPETDERHAQALESFRTSHPQMNMPIMSMRLSSAQHT
jgi:hypothetical protein